MRRVAARGAAGAAAAGECRFAHPWRRSEDRGLHLPMGEGSAASSIRRAAPLDRLGELTRVLPEPMVRRPINAMDRDPVRTLLDTGVRAINALLTVGWWPAAGLLPAPAWGKACCWG
ncbi:MAG: hypothetical protein U1F49_08580 [Rubrivivax sp.]